MANTPMKIYSSLIIKEIQIITTMSSTSYSLRCGGGGGLPAKSCPTFATPWTVARQAPLSKEFSRQEYWSGLPFPPPGDLLNPGIDHTYMSPA